MLDRAQVVDQNFRQFISEQKLPEATSQISLAESGLTTELLIDLLDSQIKSRLLDIQARKLKTDNLSYYTIGSSGHEGNAVLGAVFPYTDMAFLHYRSCALFLQRAKQLKNIDAINDVLLSLVASADDPISSGRHKVFGSVPLNIPPQTSTIASHLAKAVGAAMSITRAKELNITRNLKDDSVILCNFGDASFNHAVSQSAINSASWASYQNYPLPLVFICEDNGIGISVPTPRNWIRDSMQDRPGWHYIEADGLHLPDLYHSAKKAEQIAREKRQPVFLHVKCVRLLGHAGSDVETLYRHAKQIEATEAQDPLLHTARIILENQLMTAEQIIQHYNAVADEIEMKSKDVIKKKKLTSAKAVMRAIIPEEKKLKQAPAPSEASRKKILGDDYRQLNMKRNMSQCLNLALTDLMLANDNAIVFGEDVGKKGGVYHVTTKLQKRFGQRRVFDTLLDETTILGTAIGLAHNGFIPIPEIQFLAYYHNAEDQIRGEAATLSFFSSGQYTNPMIIRIASMAYQKGFGGHFHNDNSIAAIRDIPGVIIACPSKGDDAAKMLRTAMEYAKQGRIVFFLEPIALYMQKDLHQAGDNLWLSDYPAAKEKISLDELGITGKGNDLAIITYGNGHYLSLQAQKVLAEKYQLKTKVIDLRWLAPIDEAALIKAVKNAKKILIVDECRKTGSISEALITMLYQNLKQPIEIARLTAEDCFIPLGTAWQYVLPSKDSIIDACLALTKEKTKEKIT